MRRRSELQQRLAAAETLTQAGEELEVLTQMARDGDEGVDTELAGALKRFSPELDRIELEAKMTGDHDTSNAFVEIHELLVNPPLVEGSLQRSKIKNEFDSTVNTFIEGISSL